MIEGGLRRRSGLWIKYILRKLKDCQKADEGTSAMSTEREAPGLKLLYWEIAAIGAGDTIVKEALTIQKF